MSRISQMHRPSATGSHRIVGQDEPVQSNALRPRQQRGAFTYVADGGLDAHGPVTEIYVKFTLLVTSVVDRRRAAPLVG